MQEGSPSLSKQSIWILSAKTISFGLSILLPLVVVRCMEPEQVGVYRQAFLVVVNATSILPLGFSMSAYYFLNRVDHPRPAVIANIVLWNFLVGSVAFLVLLLFPQLLGNLFRENELERLAPLIGIAVSLSIFSGLLEIATLANREPKLATSFIILSQFARTTLLVAAVLTFATVDSIIYAAIIHGALQTVILLVYLQTRFPSFWKQFEWDVLKGQFVYVLPFGFAALLYNAQADLHNYFVGYKFDSETYAIYAYGCFQVPLIWALYESVNAVLLPKMSGLQAEGKRREMLLLARAAMQKLALAYFPIFVFLMIVADKFITTLFTEKFAASVPIFRINLILLPVYCLLLDPVERAFKELGSFLIKLRTVIVAVLVIALYFGIQFLDLRGILSIVVISVLIERGISIWRVLNVLGANRHDWRLTVNVSKIAAAATLAGFAVSVFYFLFTDSLSSVLVDLSRRALNVVSIASGSQFLGNGIALGMFFAIYMPFYLFLLKLFGAVDEDEKERFVSAATNGIRRFLTRTRDFLPSLGRV